MSLVLIEVWTYGRALMPQRYRDRRLGWCDVWHRETPDGNPYAHPVSGLKVVVDMNTLELLELENDHDHGQPAVDAGNRVGVIQHDADRRHAAKRIHRDQPAVVQRPADANHASARSAAIQSARSSMLSPRSGDIV